MELSENLKLRLENLTGENQVDRLGRPTEPASGGEAEPIDEAESQMRKALGLLGEGQRHRPESERSEPAHRMGDRFNGGLHRRRFVQDGDIPVTVLRRDQSHELPAHRGAPAAALPSSSRLQRTEAALAAETAAREKAERTLADVQALAHDLQTKIGHAELAKNEAVDALRHQRDVSAQLRTEMHGLQGHLEQALAQSHATEQASASWQDQLADERHARKSTEKALRTAEAERDEAERLVRALSEEAPASAPRRSEPVSRPQVEPEVAAAPARRARIVEQPAAEPEPVKWWLNTKPTTKRR
jgi:hypothetical protein